MAGRLAIKAAKKAKEASAAKDPQILSEWLDGGMRAESQDIVAEALDPVIEALRDPVIAALNVDIKLRDHLGEFFELMRANLYNNDGESRNEIADEAVSVLCNSWLGEN